MKLCQACNTEKPETEFYRDKTRSDGLNWRCKPCHKAHVAWVSMQPPRNPAPEGMKRCGRCKETKPSDEFYADKTQYDGHTRMCKLCQTDRFKAWSAKNLNHLAAKQRERYRKDPLRYAAYDRKRRFGLQAGDYQRMLAAQGGRCAICHTDDPSPWKHFAIDHCHDTNAIRGLLCGTCNSGIGQLKHSEELLLSAIEYLRRYTSAEGPGI